jgi:hypothetical protein
MALDAIKPSVSDGPGASLSGRRPGNFHYGLSAIEMARRRNMMQRANKLAKTNLCASL